MANTSRAFDYYWIYQWGLNVFYMDPPDIGNRTQLDRLHEVVRDMESLPNSFGADRHVFWLPVYERWYRLNRLFNHKIPHFTYR